MKHLGLIAALLALAGGYAVAKKPKKEDITQVLELPKDPPAAVTAETRRLIFFTSPLSGKGLLSAQVREALRALLKNSGGASIVKIRAFVAGSGDLRRVQAIVSETFTEKKLAIPALSVIQVGILPMEGAQVVLEATAMAKKEGNPLGVIWISGQPESLDQPLQPLAPLAEKSAAAIQTALTAAGSGPSDVLRATCFLSGLEDAAKVRAVFESKYRGAALNFVQLQRAASKSLIECEAVARLARQSDEPLRLLNPPGLPSSPNYSQAAIVTAPKIVITGTQVAYGFQDSDARLAFQRLAKVVEQAGSSMKNVAMSSIYPLSTSIAEQVRRIRFDFYDKSRPPASTMLNFEALPAMDAGFAVDVIAIAK